MSIIDLYAKRRSVYGLEKTCPLTDAETEKLLSDVLATLPSAFNSQPVRAVILFGPAHDRLWAIVLEALRAKVPAASFAPVAEKIAMFAKAHGTVLWFCDDSVTASLQKQFPSYAAHFPVWAEQAEGIAQFAVWCALRERGAGANLQHYNPLIDAKVREAFGIVAGWRLVAQMPFGAIGREDPPKPRVPAVRAISG